MPWPLIALTVLVVGQSSIDQESTDAARQERLQFFKERAGRFTLTRDGASPTQPLKLLEDPVLRYDIPERDNGTWDGAMFLWLDGKAPVAVLCVGVRRPNNAVVRELSSLSVSPLECSRSGQVVWNPQSGGLLNRPLPDAPPPSAKEAGRLTQMRSLARRFSATCYRREVATELRLMPQPLYRFSDDRRGIVDGGVFALAVGNDAEMVLLLEAVDAAGAGKPEWRFSLARMSSLDIKVRLDDMEVWSIPRFYTIPSAERKNSSYTEAMEGKFTASMNLQRTP